MLVLIVAMLPIVLGLHWIVGPILALMAIALFGLALGLTLFAQRREDTSSLDPETGLPDREAALRRLADMVSQHGSARRQAALMVVAFPAEAFANAETRRSTLLHAAIRMAHRLRKGDQIVRVGACSLAVIVAPSRGLDARSAREILDRIHQVLREPVRSGGGAIEVEASLGGCLQNDAPGSDAGGWLEAAEDAAAIASATQEPHLFWLAPGRADTARWDIVGRGIGDSDSARSA